MDCHYCDSRLLRFVRNKIAEYRECEHNDISKRFQAIEHIEWILPDTLHADFVSTQQLSILKTMKIAIRSTNCYNVDNETKSNDPTVSQSFNNVNAVVNSACLVHCAQGISRSAAVIAAYLLYNKECTN